MKKYTRPNIELITFTVEDIITASGNGVIVNSTALTGDSAEMYEIYRENSADPSTNVSVFTW